MDAEYRFAVGGIGEITNGENDKVDSLDDLDFTSSSDSHIIVPKIIGVYQNYRDISEEKVGFINALDQMGVFAETGKIEKISPDLICIAYDPTNIEKEVLEEAIMDRLKRIKIVSYNEIPDFYEKNVPENLSISDMEFPDSIDKRVLTLGQDPRPANVTNPVPRAQGITINKGRTAVLERQKNIWELLRRDYGLTRMEAINLAAVSLLMSKIKGDKIISDHFTIGFGKHILDLLKEKGFDDFLRGD